MKTVYQFLFFLSLSSSLFAQNIQYNFEELDSLMLLNYKQGDFDHAIKFAEIAVSKTKTEFGELDSTHAAYLGDLGFMYYEGGKPKQALLQFEKALDIELELFGVQHPVYMESMNALASVHLRLGNHEEAEGLFLDLLAIEKQNPDLKNYDYSLTVINLGAFYLEQGTYEKAETYLKQALTQLDKNATDEFERSKLLNSLAMTYEKMGAYELAEELYLEVRAAWEQIFDKNHPSYAAILNNLAALYFRLNKYEQAENLYLQAISIEEKTLNPRHPDFGISMNNLAELYRETDKIEKAKKLYFKVRDLVIQNVGKEHKSYALNLNNLGLLYLQINELDAAEASFLEATQIWGTIGGKNHPDYANVLVNLARVYIAKVAYLEAIPLFQKAEKIREIALGKAHPDYIETLNYLAEAYVKKGDLEQAENILQLAIESNAKDSLAITFEVETLEQLTQKSYYSIAELVRSLQVLNQLFIQENKLELSEITLTAAIQMNKKMRYALNSKKDQLRVLQQMNELTTAAIEVSKELTEHGSVDQLAKAFYFAEQNKSVLLADAVKGQRARTLSDLPEALVLQELTLQQRIRQLEKEEIEARSSRERTKIQARLNALQLQMDEFLKSIKIQYPKYYKMKYEDLSIKASEIQAALNKETVLLEYFVGDSATYLFAISSDNIRLYTIPLSRSALNKRVNSIRKSLTDYYFITQEKEKAFNSYKSDAYWFYKQLLAPALEQNSASRLIIITDGELGHLPFEAFLTDEVVETEINYKNLPYVLKKYSVSYHYSAALWNEHSKDLVRKNNGQLLAFAAAYPPLKEDAIELKHRQKHINTMRRHLQPLPSVENELATLRSSFQGQFLSGTKANEHNFKKEAEKFAVLHLAMHGILHPRVSMLSSLAFTEDGDSLNDNFLQAYEIASLQLNSDLVVLSACETGFGQFQQGEGVVSLARSFMYAGAPSLVVSLWQVNDRSTAIIMTDFYAQLGKGSNKATALRQAKLNYINASENIVAAHPAFWAPFIQLGDDRPVKIKLIPSYLTWYIGTVAALCLVGVGGLYYRRKKER